MNLIHEYDHMLSLVSSNASSNLGVVLGTPNTPAFPRYQSTALSVPLLFSLISSDYIIPNSDLAKENLSTIFWRVNRFRYCNQERKEQHILFWMCIYVFYSLIWFYFSFFWWLRQDQLVTVFFNCRFKICLFADFKILLTVYLFLNTSNLFLPYLFVPAVLSICDAFPTALHTWLHLFNEYSTVTSSKRPSLPTQSKVAPTPPTDHPTLASS